MPRWRENPQEDQGYNSSNNRRTSALFVRSISCGSNGNLACIGAVAGLGASLDKTVVAEGIETEEQMRQVKAHGCHEGQGHFFGEPMTAETIHARLAESTSVGQPVA
jgi:EAL domain-containing protein (putative c-di-GMP-specific phosphodiesterase class I)